MGSGKPGCEAIGNQGLISGQVSEDGGATMGNKIQVRWAKDDITKLHEILIAADKVACKDWSGLGLPPEHLNLILALRVAVVEFTRKEIKPC